MDDEMCDALQMFVQHSGLNRDMAREVCRSLMRGSAKADCRHTLGALHTPRSGHVLAALECGRGSVDVVAVGGNNRADGRLRSVEVLRHDSAVWEAGPELEQPRFLAGGGVVRGGVVVVAGGDDGSSYHASCELLRPDDGAGWTPGPHLPAPRRGCGSVCTPDAAGSLGGSLLLVGGCDGVEDVASTDVLDLPSGRWLAGPPLPAAVFTPSVVALDGLVYCIGGLSRDDITKTVFSLDLRCDRWTPVRPPMRQCRAGAAAAAHLGRIHVFGGQVGATTDNVRFLASSESFCPVAGRWATSQPLAVPTSGAAAVSCGDHLTLVGGAEQAEAGASEAAVGTTTLIV